MGTISSSVGLISGIDIAGLVSQLMEIEARPLRQVENRIQQTQAQQTAYLELSARLLGVKSSLQALTEPSSFHRRNATSSDEGALTASADSDTPPGTYSFTVKSLVTAHQFVSRGFADRSSSPVGAGKLSFEVGKGRVDQSTPLGSLNGYSGVGQGTIRITDRSGSSTTIDLRGVTRLDDVLDAINGQADVSVRARIDGDQLVVEDLTGQSGNLIVTDVGNGKAAEDLGIAGVFAPGETARSESLIYLTDDTPLSVLNDGLGMRRNRLASDLQFNLSNGASFEVNLSGNLKFTTRFEELNDGRGVRADEDGQRIIRITNRNGQSAEIDLSDAQTIQDVADAINNSSLSISVALAGGKLSISDLSEGQVSNLKIEDVTGQAAADLGIEVDTEDNGLLGSVIYRVDTIGGALRAIQYAEGNDGLLSAEISEDGKGIVLTDNTSDFDPPAVQALNGSMAARDLGLLGGFTGNQLVSRPLVAGPNTVLLSSLNGGNGIPAGTMDFTLHDGTGFTLDFTGATTLSDVIDIINEDGRLFAEINAGGTGIILTDETTGTETLTASGEMADAIGFETDLDGRLISGDLQLQYVAENTLLGDLNAGQGVDSSRIRITDSSGNTATLRLTAGASQTVGDVIEGINELGLGVTASINDTGDGIKLEDTAGGAGVLTVEEEGAGSAARDLGILGTADGTILAGSLARSVEIDSGDGLDEVARKINESDLGVTASVINDGSGANPYRLILTSETGGTAGTIAFDSGRIDLELGSLTEAQDATVIIGDQNSPNAVVIASSDNTLTDVVDGLTLELTGVSDKPVEVTVTQDTESVVEDVKNFIDTFNNAMDAIDQLTDYDPETEERGVLLGDNTVRMIQQELFRVATGQLPGDDVALNRLSSLGIFVDSSSGGARLSLGRTFTDGSMIDGETRLRQALEENPDAVSDLFALKTTETDEDGNETVVPTGIAVRLEELLDEITNQVDGTITQRNNALQSRVDLFNSRAADMQELLDIKEQRLFQQFQAMEEALAAMQTQQNALSSLSQLASSVSTQGLASLGGG